MTWEELDWAALERLRERFLTGTPANAPYWQSERELASYDHTYGERIGWKWDHVLRELQLRRWRPASRTVFDWGCGSGIAARRVMRCFGAEHFDSLTVWDHSPLATSFAVEAAARAFSSVRVTPATPGQLASPEPIGLLIVSHVLNELTSDQLASLHTFAGRAEEILWVEPGTHGVSRNLGRAREQFRAGGFRPLAPCTHGGDCPMLAAGNERHWCHFFAPPPPEIFADSHWVRFGQRAGIDLRSLPYSFLALSRRPDSSTDDIPRDPVGGGNDDGGAGRAAAPTALSRVIGRPEHFKPYARLLNCDAHGLATLELPKRSDPALFKHLERTKAPLVYRWRREGNTIQGGEACGGSA